jgi:hypothetical protein
LFNHLVGGGEQLRMNREIVEFLKGADIQERLAGFGLATSGAGMRSRPAS